MQNSDNSFFRPISVQKSIYQESFEEVYFIASGGFGSVYKAIHKLDKAEYAIKKVILRSSYSMDKYLEEVKTMARMNHPNVVPYKQAWIESISQIRFERPSPSTSKSKRSNVSINELRSTRSGNSSYSKNFLQQVLDPKSPTLSYLLGNPVIANRTAAAINLNLRRQLQRKCRLLRDQGTPRVKIYVNTMNKGLVIFHMCFYLLPTYLLF